MKYREPKIPKVDQTGKRSISPVADLRPLTRYRDMKRRERERWIKLAAAYVRAFISQGMTQEEIEDRLGITSSIFDKIEHYLIETDVRALREAGTGKHYYYYVLKMEFAARQLDQFIEQHKDDKTGTGVVSAIKAKAGLHGDVIRMGQELGIISKKAKEVRLLGEINLTTLETEELADLLLTRMKSFSDMVGPTKKLPAAYDNMLKRSLDRHVEQVDEEEYVEVEYEEVSDNAQ